MASCARSEPQAPAEEEPHEKEPLPSKETQEPLAAEEAIARKEGKEPLPTAQKPFATKKALVGLR